MSFTRNNIFYQSLPINNSSSKYNNGSTMTSANLNPKTVNFNMQQQQQQQQLMQETASDLSSSSSSSKLQPTSAINTEEFAKLDALLEDLLAEVDQPILLSKETTISNKYGSTNGGGGWSSATTGPSFNGGQHLEDFEKSVNWLNEQKEILRSRREAAAANKYHSMGSSSTSRLMGNGTADASNQNDENLLNTSLNNQPYRKIKSKLDYYITNSNDGASNATNGRNNNNNNNNNNGNKYSFTYTSSSNSDNLKATNFNNENNFNDITESLNGIATNTNNNDLIDDTNTLGGNLRQIPIVNNKPPVSPNTRNLYSPTQQQQQQQQQQPQSTLISSSFRSLSNNPTALLKNINETDDENLIDSEFDRYSQKSYKSTASTIQRSKYHTVSNDYTECTRPSAPTPVPTYNTNRSFYQSKRALSAPPTEIGKIVLQRMELKSPLTVRQTSVVPFESAQNFVQGNNDAQMTMNQAQAPPNVTYTTLANRSFIDNPYNNRGVLKTNYNITNQPALVGGQQQPQQQQQQLPVRNVYLNRSYSETPRVGYTNGYETDSGLVSGPNNYRMNTTNGTIGGYNTTARAYNGSYGGNQLNDSDIETSRGSTINYRSGNTGVMANSYRTIGPTSRYQLINDQTGYDTDTGLIKLRQVLDSRRASSSRNNVPLHGAPVAATSSSGYLYPNRCITPSFASYTSYNGAGSQQPIRVISQYNSQTNIPLNDHQRYGGAGSQEQMGSQYLVNAYPTSYIDQAGNTVSYLEENVQFVPTTTVQQINSIEYIDANGNITTGVPAFVSPDGRQIILKDIDPISGFGEAIVTPPTQQLPLQIQSPQQQQQTQSMIIQHQVAPSSYNQSNIVRTNSQQRVETPNRINGGIVSSNSNLSTITNTTINQKQDQQSHQQQQQQIQQQQQQQQSSQMTREDSKRGLSTSLTESNEVIRVHPKQVKSNLNFWYKPTISREEAIRLLKDKPPGTFLIRDSNNFPGAYGLALKVEKPPPNIQIKPGTDPSNELVRHFLIEPTSKGVRIKGCCNEPVFGSLAALVYQHSLTSLALPLKLLLPTEDLIPTGSNVTSPTNVAPANSNLNTNENINNNNTITNKSTASSTPLNSKQPTAQAQTIQDGRQLLEKGAACNVYYLNTVNIENKNGLDGISNALSATKAFVEKNSSALLLIQFKVTSQGITITDLNKKKFIKKHFPTNSIIYCAVDEKFTWPNKLDKIGKPRIFGVICKPEVTKGSNECHLFVELDPEQPAIAIVDFINRYLIPSKLNLKS